MSINTNQDREKRRQLGEIIVGREEQPKSPLSASKFIAYSGFENDIKQPEDFNLNDEYCKSKKLY